MCAQLVAQHIVWVKTDYPCGRKCVVYARIKACKQRNGEKYQVYLFELCYVVCSQAPHYQRKQIPERIHRYKQRFKSIDEADNAIENKVKEYQLDYAFKAVRLFALTEIARNKDECRHMENIDIVYRPVYMRGTQLKLIDHVCKYNEQHEQTFQVIPIGTSLSRLGCVHIICCPPFGGIRSLVQTLSQYYFIR